MPHWLASLVGALLPDPQRTAFVRRHGGDPPRASMALGAVEFLTGAHLVYENAMAYFRPLADGMAGELMHQANRRSVGSEDVLALTWGGSVVWIFWLLQPTTWLLLSIPAVGLLRSSAYLTTRQAVGEPAVWALLHLGRLGSRLVGSASERAEFGDAASPDEVVADGEATLLVHAARPREAWNELVTIEVAGRFYRVAAKEVVTFRGRRRYRYRLVAAGEHDVIRRLLRYEPPPAGSDAQAATRSARASKMKA